MSCCGVYRYAYYNIIILLVGILVIDLHIFGSTESAHYWLACTLKLYTLLGGMHTVCSTPFNSSIVLMMDSLHTLCKPSFTLDRENI